MHLVVQLTERIHKTVYITMVEPVSVTLGGLALFDPAIRAVRKAYGVYRLTRAFGEDFASVQRRLDGQQARLEIALDTSLASIPGGEIANQIIVHLGHMKRHFDACQDLVTTIDGDTSKF